MKIIDTHFEGLKVIVPKVWEDSRGYFFESFHKEKYQNIGQELSFCQDNEAFSAYGVIRGLHYQKGEFAQGKLVRVIYGEVLDIVVDIRPSSSTYGKSFSLLLNDVAKKQLYVPPGFAHGYAVLSKEALFSYKCTDYYYPASEGGIHPLDKTLSVDWLIPQKDQVISEKDLRLPVFDKHEPIW